MGIYARRDGEWYSVGEGGSAGELPGIGGWATITDVKGKGKKYAYGDWVAYEWTADGSVTNTEGLVDLLVVGGGSAKFETHQSEGGSGDVREGLHFIEGGEGDVVIGKGGQHGNSIVCPGLPSSIKSVRTGYGFFLKYSAGATGTGNPERSALTTSSIRNGTPETYAGVRAGNIVPSSTGYGDGHDGQTNPGYDGVVILRVPKDQDHFTDITGSETGEPFDIPTTRQKIVEALEEKVEEAKEAVRDRRKRR